MTSMLSAGLSCATATAPTRQARAPPSAIMFLSRCLMAGSLLSYGYATTRHPTPTRQPAPWDYWPARRVGLSGSLLPAERRIEQIAQPVPGPADHDRREHQHDAGRCRDPPGGVQILAPLVHHPAPRRGRRLDAQAEERERRLEHDRARQLERGDDDQGREHIGQHVPDDDARDRAAERVDR